MTTKNHEIPSSGSKKVLGYFRRFSRFVSKYFLFVLLVILMIAGILYITLFHVGVVQFWREKQKLSVFMLDSPYLAEYNGRAQLLLSGGALLYEGDTREAVVEGQGELYRDNSLIYGHITGTFLENKYNGKGKLYSDVGRLLYNGEFAGNLYHGVGLLYNEDNTVLYDGMFAKDLYHGARTLYNGTAYYIPSSATEDEPVQGGIILFLKVEYYNLGGE